MSYEGSLTVEFKVDGGTVVESDSGESAETKDGAHIRRLQVDQRLDSPDYFAVEIFLGDEEGNIKLLDKLKPGATVEIVLGYDESGTVFKGEISYIEPSFAAKEATVTVSGYDLSHRLTRGTSSRTFGDGHAVDVDPGSIAGTVVGESKARKGDKSDGLSADTGSSSSKLEYIAQYNQNDYQFIQQVIGSFGFGWDSQSHEDDKKISLKATEPGSSVLTIARDKFDAESETIAINADFRLSTVRQVAGVEVRGWSPSEKKSFVGKAESLEMTVGDGVPGIEQAGKAHYGAGSAGRVLTIVDLPVADEAEAKQVAQSILDKLSMDFMTADLLVEGRPTLHAGVVVTVKEFGKRFSGDYLVEGCQHVYIPGSGSPYRTYLKGARNCSPEE